MTDTDSTPDTAPAPAPVAVSSVRAGLDRTRAAFSSLADRRYRWWFSGQVLSSSGHVTQAAGLAWLVLDLSGRAVDLGLVTTAAMLPILVGAAPAGTLVDRFDRRRLLLVTQVLLLSLGAVLAVLTATGAVTVPLVLAFAFASGVVAAVDGPARQVFVLDLVGPERLASAVSLYEVVMNAARVIGPSVGGVLLALVGPAACFAFNATTYLLPLGVLLALRGLRARTPVHVGERPAAGFRAGVAYAWGQPVIRACVLLAAASTMIFNQGVMVPVLATDALGLPPQGFGALMAAFGLGALPGAIAAAGGGAPSGRRVAVLAFATGVAILPVGLAPGFAVAVVAAAVLGFVSIWWVAAANTLVQLVAAPHLRGRVMGVWTAALPGSGLVTALALGAVTDTWGVRWAYVALAASFLAAAAAGARALVAHDRITGDPDQP
ncbi:MFS transporter [Cellulomonas algicola]|uniref:MFS transporter n=1 Tax=Cellulomonas algicola TaxID=2071633 RepID=A0A401UVA1_9CELL|nr:MFS transporter [Cellulomonas algicola]GCD18615.1 MFS transporter [Cellulomonas algicola]